MNYVDILVSQTLLDNLRMKSGDKISTYNVDFMRYAS